ncbi:MAG: glycosyltransferase family 9 protein [Gammaproteobacteria bacterium]|nr:glycosyltransferase family 9 protein [Gammaproteobacteria bacterium]MDH5799710.1 glycosyltransferase family 9 protein [Gammaproteobacteria bacterium]
MKMETSKRILLIRAGQLGDTVCASSIIEPLRAIYGEDVQIHWVAKRGMGRIFAADPRIDRIFELKSRRSPLLLNPGKFAVVLESMRQPYDLVVNLELGSMFNSMMRLLRAKQKVGMPFRLFEEPEQTHAVENLQLIYRSFLPESALEIAEPSLIGSPEVTIRQKFSIHGKYVVLVPSNSHHGAAEKNYRAWPVPHWRELIKRLSEKETTVVIVGGKNEQEYFTRLQPYPENVQDLVGRTDFPELVGLLQHAAAVVSTDTGPAHIAGAVAAPVLTLIGPTNPRRTAPYKTRNNSVHIISSNLECSPCYHSSRYEQCTDNQCMALIQPEVVLEKLNRVLSQTPQIVST